MIRVLALVSLSAFLSACGGGVGVVVFNRKDTRTPLEKASQDGDLAEVRRLLASGADPNDRAGVFGCPLNAAALHAHNAGIVRALLAAGANPNGRGDEGNACWASPLFQAVSSNEIENARVLLDAGASLQVSRCSKLVAGWLKSPVIDLLVAHGWNLLAVDERGRNELHLALSPPVVPDVESIEYLIHAGVALNARDRSGKTPLAYWREPRDFESHWISTWLIERLGDSADFRRQREARAVMSALLERSGAVL